MTQSFFWTGLLQSHVLPVFLQSQSHCYKGAITLQQGCNHPHSGFATVFFVIAAHQWLQPHVKDDAITCIFTGLQPHQANTNLVAIWQCLDMEFFFETVFLQSHFFTCVFATVFFLQSQFFTYFCNCFFSIAIRSCFCNCFFFNQTAVRLQSHLR
jgi:hypothetical protein